jgi:hypothetical protein
VDGFIMAVSERALLLGFLGYFPFLLVISLVIIRINLIMASGYILDHIIQECLQEKIRVMNTSRGKCNDAKVDIYANSWIALNAWLEARLSKHKVN